MEVYQHSSAGWLEDQDFFRFSGIFRSVYLYAKPAVHVDDVWFRTVLLEDNVTGTLKLRLLLSGETENAALHCTIGGLMDAPRPPDLRRQILRQPHIYVLRHPPLAA